MSIKEKVDKLTVEQRRQLSHAFDHGFSQYVEFGRDEFVAVHVDFNKMKHLLPREQAGIWSYGNINKKE